MAGGGGSAGYQVIDTEQNSMHQMLMRGRYGTLATAKSWDGLQQANADIPYSDEDAFVDEPSLLRFIHDSGTTEAGGNPYEGVSAYEPGDDLDKVDGVIEDFQELVEALDHDTDWEDDVASAVAQKSTAVPTLDYDAVFSNVISTALTSAASSVSTIFEDAKADINALVDAVTTKGLADSATAIAGIINDEKAGAVTAADTLREGALNDTYIDTAITAAKADTTALLETAVEKAKAQAEKIGSEGNASAAMSMLNSGAKSDSKGSMSEAASESEDRSETLLASIHETVLDVAADAETASDNVIDDAEDDVVTAMASQAAKVVTLHTALAAEVEASAGTVMDNAKSKADTAAAARVDDGKGKADTIADAGVAKGRTFSLALVDSLVAGAVTAGQTNTTAVESTIRANGKAAMLDIVNSVNPEVSPIIMEAVVNAKSTAVTVMVDAVNAAVDSLKGAPIDAVVSSFRKRGLKTHLRGVNRFAGGMADINAVNSSAFVIGMALLESDFTDNVTDYQAKLELQVFSDVLPQFLATFQATVSAYMDSYEKRFSEYLDIYKSSIPMQTQLFLSVMPEYLRTYMTGFSEYMKAYQEVIGLYSQAHQTATDGYLGASQVKSQTTLQFTEMQSRLQTAFADVRSGIARQLSTIQAQAFGQALNAHSEMTQHLTSLSEDATKESIGSGGKLAKDLVNIYMESFKHNVDSRATRVNSLDNHYMGTFDKLVDARMSGYQMVVTEELKAVEAKLMKHLEAFTAISQTQFQQSMNTEMAEKSHKQTFMNEGVRSLTAGRIRELEGSRGVALMVSDTGRARIIAKNEEYDRNLEFDGLAANWNLELFQQAGNVIGAVTGTVVPKAGKPSKTQSILGGAFSGASAGASFGLPGQIIGGIAGAIAGAN